MAFSWRRGVADFEFANWLSDPHPKETTLSKMYLEWPFPMCLCARGCHQDTMVVSGIKEVVVVVLLLCDTSFFDVQMTRALETESSAS